MDETSRFMRVEEIADRLRISPVTVRKKWPLLGGFKVLGSIRFDWETTHQLILQANQGETPAAFVKRIEKVDRRSRRKAYFERVPDRHGLLDPPEPKKKSRDGRR